MYHFLYSMQEGNQTLDQYRCLPGDGEFDLLEVESGATLPE